MHIYLYPTYQVFVLYVYNWSGSQKVFILRNVFYRILFGSSLVDRDLPIASNGFTTVVLVELIFKKFLYQPDIFYDFNQLLTWYLASQTKCPYVFESYHLLCDNPRNVWKQWFYFPSPSHLQVETLQFLQPQNIANWLPNSPPFCMSHSIPLETMMTIKLLHSETWIVNPY